MTCYSATVSCLNSNPAVAPIQLDFGVLMHANPHGLIVILSGGNGTMPTYAPGADSTFATNYYNNGYTVVQTKWGGGTTPWELANGSNDYNVLQAACRPAGFLYYARYNTNPQNGPVLFPTTQTAGMCVHGFSAGSAAAAFVLAWYGGASFIDKVELLSGPVVSDIAQGCVVPPPPHGIDICGTNPSYCQGWPAGGLIESPDYVFGTEDHIRMWTGDNSCRGPQNTTQASYNAWLAQSIVNGPNGGGGNFLYPKTAMQAWLCSSDTDGTYNESGPQGWIFYSQVAQQSSLPNNFLVNAVGSCGEPEGVVTGYVSSTSRFYPNSKGVDAITTDMSDLAHSQTVACQNLH